MGDAEDDIPCVIESDTSNVSSKSSISSGESISLCGSSAAPFSKCDSRVGHKQFILMSYFEFAVFNFIYVLLLCIVLALVIGTGCDDSSTIAFGDLSTVSSTGLGICATPALNAIPSYQLDSDNDSELEILSPLFSDSPSVAHRYTGRIFVVSGGGHRPMCGVCDGGGQFYFY